MQMKQNAEGSADHNYFRFMCLALGGAVIGLLSGYLANRVIQFLQRTFLKCPRQRPACLIVRIVIALVVILSLLYVMERSLLTTTMLQKTWETQIAGLIFTFFFLQSQTELGDDLGTFVRF